MNKNKYVSINDLLWFDHSCSEQAYLFNALRIIFFSGIPSRDAQFGRLYSQKKQEIKHD